MVPFREQNNGLIVLNSAYRRLLILEAWRRSSSVYWIRSPFPATALQFKVGKADKSEFAVILNAQNHPSRGLWRVYVPGRYFTDRCETAYKIVATDEYGNRTTCGEGILRVFSGTISDIEEEESTSEECYAKFSDGKWRKVTIGEDEVGALVFEVSTDAIDESHFEKVPANPYAYNKAYGTFHAVSGFIDESGSPYIEIEQSPSAAGSETFAKDERTGFYFRIESFTDEAGAMAPQVGDQKE